MNEQCQEFLKQLNTEIDNTTEELSILKNNSNSYISMLDNKTIENKKILTEKLNILTNQKEKFCNIFIEIL